MLGDLLADRRLVFPQAALPPARVCQRGTTTRCPPAPPELLDEGEANREAVGDLLLRLTGLQRTEESDYLKQNSSTRIAAPTNCSRRTQDAEEIARLRACARIMGQMLIGARLSDKGFTLPDVVLAYVTCADGDGVEDA